MTSGIKHTRKELLKHNLLVMLMQLIILGALLLVAFHSKNSHLTVPRQQDNSSGLFNKSK